ncbi:MAG: YbgA family protein [Aquificaceae bacterium]
MRDFPRPKLVLSRCFFEAVRYDGGIITDPFVERLKGYVDFITVCPEVDIGLGTPRQRIVVIKEGESKRLFQPETGKDITQLMEDFSVSFLSRLEEVDGFLLKSKSPSCGVGTTKLYVGDKVVGRTYGFFAQAIKEKLPHMPLEDEGRLRDGRIREHFLTRIYAFADFRHLKKNFSPRALVEFQSTYKYLLMTYSQKALKELGQIVARVGKEPERALRAYEEVFHRAFAKIPSPSKHTNTLLHILGHISRRLNSMEKRHLISLIQKVKNGRTNHRLVVEILRNIAYRHGEEYLLKQKYFDPFPEELMEN